MIITVRWTEWLQGAQVERFGALPEAQAYEESLPADQTAYVFDTDAPRWLESQWANIYSTPKMAQIFIALGGQVTKFPNYDSALRRVSDRIIELARGSDLRRYVPSTNSSDPETTKTIGTTMPKEAKLGEFRQVRRSSNYGKVLQQVLANEGMTVGDIAVATGLDHEKVISSLRAARKGHGIGYAISDSGEVSVTLPTGEDEDTVFAPEKETPEGKAPREYKVGEFRQVRRGAGLGKLVEAALAGGTVDEVGARLGETGEQVTAALKSLRRTHGIGYEVEGGEVRLVVPEDQDPFIAPAERAARPEGAPRKSKGAELDAKAAAGEVPEKPVVTSPTNMHRQKHFDALAAHAEAGEWDKIEAYHMSGIDSYSAMINRYRDRLLAAHRATSQLQQTAAE